MRDKKLVLFTGFKEVRVTFLTGGFFDSQVVWQGGSEWNSPLRGEIIRVGDVNGDGYSDLLVHDTEGSTVLIINKGGMSSHLE